MFSFIQVSVVFKETVHSCCTISDSLPTKRLRAGMVTIFFSVNLEPFSGITIYALILHVQLHVETHRKNGAVMEVIF